MALYKNSNSLSPIAAVEFAPVVDGNFCFFYVANPQSVSHVKSWLQSPGIQQDVITQTQVDGQTVLLTQGHKSQDEIWKNLKANGDNFQFHHKTKGISELAWPLRSALGISGQCLQLTSSLMRGKRDLPLLMFSVSNLTANGINVLFGAQRSEDVNRLRFLKTRINDQLGQFVPAGSLPDVDDNRKALRHERREPQTEFQQFHNFIKKHSVTVGEIGLRYFGALSLTSDRTAPLRRAAGWTSIVGKTTALFSQPEDTFDRRHRSALDTFREKFTFRLGGLTEAAAFLTLAVDGFNRQTIKFPDKGIIPASLRGKTKADYLSGVGALLFTAGYIIRSWAKFGVKETNMEELYAHVSDSLAMTPPNQMPKLLADTAAYITMQFKDKNLDYGKVFTQLTTDLYRYHHIVVGNKATIETPHAQQAEAAPLPVAQTKVTQLGRQDDVQPLPLNHRERLEAAATLTAVQR